MSEFWIFPAHPHELEALCLGGRFAIDEYGAALSSHELVSVPLAAPILHPLAWGTPDASGCALTGLTSEALLELMLAARLEVDGDVVPARDLLPDEAERRDALGYGWGLQRLLRRPSNDPEVQRARARFTEAGRHPEHLLLISLPILPRASRPDVEGQGSTEVLYLRVLQLNARLRFLLEQPAAYGPINHTMENLTRAMEHLFVNGREGRLVVDDDGRACTSLLDRVRARFPGLDVHAAIRGDEPPAQEPLDDDGRRLLAAFGLVRRSAGPARSTESAAVVIVEDLGLSVRTCNLIKTLGVTNSAELATYSEADLKAAGFRLVDLRGIRDALEEWGLPPLA